jgi:hypothetical protein
VTKYCPNPPSTATDGVAAPKFAFPSGPISLMRKSAFPTSLPVAAAMRCPKISVSLLGARSLPDHTTRNSCELPL